MQLRVVWKQTNRGLLPHSFLTVEQSPYRPLPHGVGAYEDNRTDRNLKMSSLISVYDFEKGLKSLNDILLSRMRTTPVFPWEVCDQEAASVDCLHQLPVGGPPTDNFPRSAPGRWRQPVMTRTAATWVQHAVDSLLYRNDHRVEELRRLP